MISAGTRAVTAAAQIGEVAWLAPQVVALRLTRLAHSPAACRRESARMVREKGEALLEIVGHGGTRCPRTIATVTGRTVGAVHRRVVANHRRLTLR